MKTLLTFSLAMVFAGFSNLALAQLQMVEPSATPTAPAPPTAPAAPAANAPAAASGNQSDSTEIKMGGINIRIAEDGEGAAVEVDMDPSVTKDVVTTEWAMMDIGINGLIQDGDFQLGNEAAPFDDLRYGRSLNLDMHLFRQRVSLVQRKFNLEYGLTFSWYNYSFQDDVILDPDADMFAYAESADPLRKSKLSMTYLTIPLMLNLETNPDQKSKSFRFSAGMTGGIRIASKSKIKTENNLKTKQRDDFNLNDFRYGPTVRIGYGWFNLYGQYAMSELFADGEGTPLHPFTVGISIRAF
ncbi:MAG: outer membrane beta-barrel protein [Bacteroidetes bacterium]|nr:outer membrane beta-barrel protein [Bacteroidota bacterium]